MEIDIRTNRRYLLAEEEADRLGLLDSERTWFMIGYVYGYQQAEGDLY